MNGDLIERALQDVSDGKPVDWDQLVDPALGEDEREQLKWLRVLDDIAELYKSIHDSTHAEDRATGGHASRPGTPEGPQATWGRYQLLEKVGEGGFGSVHRAWDPQLECEVAIKILHQRDADHRLTQRLLDEGRALARIRHPNVVRVLGVESNEGRVGLCMDFVRGQTLGDLVQTQGSLSADEAALVGRDVCAALAAVHRAGFVHRDVKAGNVMREQAGRIVLMDFGAGREFNAHEGHKRDMTGTPSYMAPEVLAREPASTRSDVYSVGVLLYYLVTAEYPVPARTLDELRIAHQEGQRRSLSERRPDLPGPFVRVVERALAVDPDERYANAGALLDALGAVVGGDNAKAIDAAGKPMPLPLVAVVSAAGAFVFAGALGALSSVVFNSSLGLAGFAADTPWDYVVWGFKSVVLPATLIMVAVSSGWLLASPVSFLRNFITTRSTRAANLDRALRGCLRTGGHRLGLDDAETLSSVVLWLSGASLAVAWWYFGALMRSCIEPISGAPTEQLALLGPALLPVRDLYRTMFTGLVVGGVLSWYLVLHLASRQGKRVSLGMLTGGAAVLALTIATLDFPYRVLRHSQFEAARWNDQMCYITGERAADFLLFCPELQPPRNRVVPKSAGSVERLGLRENIFARFVP